MKQATIYDTDIYNKIFSLPKNLKAEVLHFAEFLKLKTTPIKAITEREFGCAKNAFVMKDDFDEPLEDFKEYM
jgi:hypothetical protein